MIEDSEKSAIREIALKYSAKRVILFGSSMCPGIESHDIDIAVEGIEAKDFFSFYGDLMFALSKPVDVIDISSNSRFVDLIKKEGITIYA